MKNSKEYQREYMKRWRKTVKGKQARNRWHFKNKLTGYLIEAGYRLSPDDPRAKGSFNPLPLRRKLIQTGRTLSMDEFGVMDFNVSLISPTSPIINPMNTSLLPIINETPNLPDAFFITFNTDLPEFALGSGRSSRISSGIELALPSFTNHNRSN